MDKSEYIRLKESPTAVFDSVIHYYYLLKGGVIKDQNLFMELFTKYLLAKSRGFVSDFRDKLAKVNVFVIIELDKHFGIS